MIRPLSVLLLSLLVAVAISDAAQEGARTPKTPEEARQWEEIAANPARPTVSTPATLTPVGYFQFETGFLAAWHSPELSRTWKLRSGMQSGVRGACFCSRLAHYRRSPMFHLALGPVS